MKGALLMSIMDSISKKVNELLARVMSASKGDYQKNPALKRDYQKSWYFSPEGKQAYENLSSFADKTHFFYNYLRVIEGKSDIDSASSFLFKIAYIMASSMVDSKLEFAGYPNILDAKKNPFIYYAARAPRHDWGYHEDLSLDTLDVLHSKFEVKGDLCFCDENEQAIDLYKIERDIILMFAQGYYSSETDILDVYSRVLDNALGIDQDIYYNDYEDEDDNDYEDDDMNYEEE